jgi:hypothetical protein
VRPDKYAAEQSDQGGQPGNICPLQFHLGLSGETPLRLRALTGEGSL